MNPTVEYHFTASSPWSYFGHDRFVVYCQQSPDRVAGIRTRSLFGKGLRDVLFTQEQGLVQSIRDGKSYVCKFRLRSRSGENKPVIEIANGPRKSRRASPAACSTDWRSRLAPRLRDVSMCVLSLCLFLFMYYDAISAPI
jgi:hypothetical protein